MADLFSVSNIFFEVLGYEVSYLEFVGTVAYFASVLLIARKNMLTWPIGILSVLLFMLLFYQVQLYSDALEQVYYLGASVVGWLLWRKHRVEREIPSGFSSAKTLAVVAIGTATLGLALGAVMSSVHLWLPSFFALPAAFPYLDAITTVMSFAAMWLLVLRRTESWVYWILVDILAIYIYFSKGLLFLGLQYIALLAIAIFGLVSWVNRESEDKYRFVDSCSGV
jgi:nicotinamide mononucleotide transporter